MRGGNEKVSGGAGMTNAISVKDRLYNDEAFEQTWNKETKSWM